MTTIQEYELYRVPPRWLFLRLTTDDGITGWGEPIIEGWAEVVESAVERLVERHLLDTEVESVERAWRHLYNSSFYRGGPVLMSAIAGIDQALWDIAGKRHDVPVHELLGGKVRDRVRVYRNVSAESKDELRSLAQAAVEDGYDAIKVYPVTHTRAVESPAKINEVVNRVGAVREAVGSEVDIAIDLHGRISASRVRGLCRELDNFDPLFIEEPIRPERVLTANNRSWEFDAPLALGERLYTRWEFAAHLQHVPVDIIQPDPSHACGLSEVRRVANLAESNGVDLALNSSVGPVAFAACLQLSAHASNAVVQPTPENTRVQKYTDGQAASNVKDGYAAVGTEPGLGIKIDEAEIEACATTGSEWTNPVWRDPDGSIAEW